MAFIFLLSWIIIYVAIGEYFEELVHEKITESEQLVVILLWPIIIIGGIALIAFKFTRNASKDLAKKIKSVRRKHK